MDTCAICGRQDQLKLCSRCHAAKYCSKECQTRDWKTHKVICKKPGQPPVDLPAHQQNTAHETQANSQKDDAGNGPAPTRQITSLYMSRIDMSLRDGRWLQYFSDELGLSELDLSSYIGNDNGELVWGSTNFHLTTARAQLVNGHVLAARVYRADVSTLVDSWINLDTYIHCDDEVLVYDPDRVKLGEIVWPWTMDNYRVHYPEGDLITSEAHG